MRLLALIFGAALALSADASTYYIASNGSDSNNGASTAAPWAHHPYMRNFTGAYTHAAGDRFIFRGGDTWGNACFTMQVMAGGAFGNPDYYGVDQTWFAGAAWTRPVFDAGGVELAGGYDVMVLLSLANAPHDIVFDNLDLRNLYWTGAKAYSWVAFFNLSVSQNVTIQNCFLHNWTHGTAGSGTSDSLKCVIGANSSPFNYGCVISNCVIDGENAANSTPGQSSGEATFAYSGNILGTTARNMASGFIVTGAVNSTNAQEIARCEVGPTYMSFDSGAHPDAIFMNGGSLYLWHDNFIHGNAVENVFCGNGSGTEQTYIYNNVIWDCPTHSPVEIDNISAASGHVYLWNNTMVGGGFPAVRVVNRGNGNLASLDLRNNHGITDSSFLAIDAGGGVTALTNANNVVQTVSAALVTGYTPGNRYQPTSTSAPTYNAGQDLWSAWRVTPGFPVATNGSMPNLSGTADRHYWRTVYHDAGGNYDLLSTDLNGVTSVNLQYGLGLWAPTDIAYQSNVLAGISTATDVQLTRVRTDSDLPTTITLIDEAHLINSDSRGGGIVFTKLGGIVATWSQQTYFVTNGNAALVVGIAYMPPGGNAWITHFPIVIEGTVSGLTSLTGWPIAVNPSDGSIWSFYKRDSYHWIEGIRCVESGGDVVITQFPKMLSDVDWGEFAIEGELPFKFATGDEATGTVAYVYERNHFQIFSASPFRKGAFMGIAFIKPDGSILKFGSVDNWTEREAPLAVVGDNRGHFGIGYLPMNTNGIISTNMVFSQYDGTATNAFSTNFVNANTWFFYTSTRPLGGAFYQDFTTKTWRLLTQPVDVLGMPRPQSLVWDAGAYEFQAAAVQVPGTLAFSVPAQSVSENGGFVGVTVVRSGGVNGAVSVTASTANGSAVAGHDYTATTTTLSWGDGATGARSFSVPILNSGDTATTNRTFTVSLSGATGGATIGSPAAQTVTIVMNPPPPPPPPATNAGIITFTQTSFSVPLTVGSVTIPVMRVNGTNAAVTVRYQTVNGSAQAGTDYTFTAGTLTWSANENGTKNITVPITNSGRVGAPVNFTVALSNPTGGASLGGALASVSIVLNPVVVPLSGVTANGKVKFEGSVTITFK